MPADLSYRFFQTAHESATSMRALVMKYENGMEARLGDVVEYNGNRAVVIANADTEEAAEGYEDVLQQFLKIQKTGILVYTNDIGVVAFFYPSPQILLIKRSD